MQKAQRRKAQPKVIVVEACDRDRRVIQTCVRIRHEQRGLKLYVHALHVDMFMTIRYEELL